MIGILKTSLQNIDKDFFAIHNLNKLTETTTASCLFCNNINDDFELQISTNILHRSHAFRFNGILITDDLTRSQDLINTTYAKKRFLYLYHLEWPYINNLHFAQIQRTMLNDDIELIARSHSHAELIENLFKKPKYIMPEWDYETLIEVDKNE